MKFFLSILFYFLATATFSQTLNNFINKSQHDALKSSPYSDAKYFAISKLQTQFRLKMLPKTIRHLLFYNTTMVDTLWIVESFDNMCPDCSSYASDLLYKDSLYSYNKLGRDSASNIKFTATKFSNKLSLYHIIILEVVDKVRQKNNWLANPLLYGSNDCNDGDHTLVTIVYPDKHIESLYVRCWTEPDYRIRK